MFSPAFFRSCACRLWLVFVVLAHPAAAQVVLNAQEQAISDYLHTSAQHRPFLKLDPVLTQVARARAADMGRRHYFNHVNPDGHGPNYMVRAAGYALPAWWGTDPQANYVESIAGGRSSASTTWSDWMNSPPHKEHLLATTSFDRDNTSYGVGYVAVPGSPYTHYWVVITCPPAPAPKLAITSPAAGARVTSPSVTVTGTASSESAPASIVYRVETNAGAGGFLAATGTTAWSASATGLSPGVNTIRVRSLNASGGVIAELTRALTYVVVKPLTVEVAGNGVVTAGFLGTTDREVGHSYTIAAAPKAGWIFQGWTGSVASKTPAITFAMAEDFAVTANFIENPFVARAGAYAGLLSGSEQGMVQVTVATNGVFTGVLRYGAGAYVLRGRLQADGTATLTVARPKLSPLTVTLQLDVTAANGFTATVNEAGQISSATAGATYRAAAGKFVGAGTYTISIAPSATAGTPRGSGYGRLTIDTRGRAKLSFSLADGTPASVGGTFSSDRVLYFYTPLYVGQGALTGTLAMPEQELGDLGGTVRWMKPALPAAKIHPEAVDASGPIYGSPYVRPKAGTRVLDLVAGPDNSFLMMGSGDLPGGIVQSTTIDTANRVTLSNPALPKLSVAINAASGVFAGTFTHPVTGKPSPLRGVFFHSQNMGVGYFLGAEESGSVRLMAK